VESKDAIVLPDIERILNGGKWGAGGFWKRCLLIAGSATLGLLRVNRTGNQVRRGLFWEVGKVSC